MNAPSLWIRGLTASALLVGLVISPEASAGGKKGGGGHPSGGGHAPRMTAAHRSSNPAPHNTPRPASHPNNANAAKSNANVAHVNNNAKAHVNTAQTHTAKVASTAASTPNTYHYGSGTNTRRYQAYGYGRGYKNHYYAHRTGYGRSQGTTRTLVSRLRSVHTSLSRLNSDYHSHRSRAMNHLSNAIRQLSHRSMVSTTNGSIANLNSNRLNINNGLNGRRTTQPLSQAHSDQRLAQALRTTQGISMQMSHQGTNSATHIRAYNHVNRAIREMHTALQTH